LNKLSGNLIAIFLATSSAVLIYWLLMQALDWGSNIFKSNGYIHALLESMLFLFSHLGLGPLIFPAIVYVLFMVIRSHLTNHSSGTPGDIS